MDAARRKARFDWLVELGGASALGLAGGYAAAKLAPSFAVPTMTAMTVAGFGSLAAGLLVMRRAHPGAAEHVLAEFAVAPIEADELLLDTPNEDPVEEDVLLLEDALPEPDPASRVVQLFASPPIPTPGQLKERIDRHLATGSMHVVREFEGPAPDAADALFAALSELKRTLR